MAFRLDIAHLACRRGGRLVFADVSLRVGSGDAIVVTGRNGAGKSTLLAAIAGLIPCERGSISLSAGGRAADDTLHLLAHRDGTKAQLTPAENLAFASDLLGSVGGMPAGAALRRVGLGPAAAVPAGFLSAGQRRRLALARLLVAPRPLWLLDEPTSALDTDGQTLLAALMAEHRAGGGVIVAATHLPLLLPGAATLVLGRSEVAA